MKLDAHAFFQLLYVLRGRGKIHLPDFKDLSLQSGDLVLIPPQTSHGLQDENGAPLSIYATNFAPRFLEFFAPFESPSRVRRPQIQTAMPELLRRLLLEQSLQKSGFEAMMNGLGFQILALAVRAKEAPAPQNFDFDSPAKTRVALYHAELSRTFYRAETVDGVAARLGLSRRHFTQLFREISGDSWLSCVRKLRVKHAQKLLVESNRTVLAIAFECGFEELSSFYRAFKTVSGTSPDLWRKSGGK